MGGGETTPAGDTTASGAVSWGSRRSGRKSPPTASATRRLVTPVADDKPTAGVDVLVPTAPAMPASVVEIPSASTPWVIVCISGRTQLASLMRWQMVMVPAAFMAAAPLATANGAASDASTDHEMPVQLGSPTQAA